MQSEAGLCPSPGSGDAEQGRHLDRRIATASSYSGYSPRSTGGKNREGGRVEVTMLEALGEWMGYPLYTPIQRRRAYAPAGPCENRAVWPLSTR